MAQVVFTIVAVWLCLLALGPLVGFTSDLARALLVAALVGWVAALIVPGRFRRYQPVQRSAAPSLQDASAPAGLTQRRTIRIAAKKTVTNLSLSLVSCLLGVLLCELTLRNFYPKYQGAAESQFDRDPILLWSRLKNSRGWFRNPDSGSYHPYHHNNLRMRQHRDFSEMDLEDATNMGFFGDSFLENQGMESQYSLTEPLDYLLNLDHRQFNTLNFGVSAYGTGQSFLRYESFRYAETLDHVFYVFTDNDLRNIYENGLFYLDEAGELARSEAIRSSWWIRLVSGLHISYLLLDVGQRLPLVLGEAFASLEEYLFRKDSLHHLRMERNERYGSPLAIGIEHDFRKGVRGSEYTDSIIAVFQKLRSLLTKAYRKCLEYPQ